jgi:hypothetical protein
VEGWVESGMCTGEWNNSYVLQWLCLVRADLDSFDVNLNLSASAWY